MPVNLSIKNAPDEGWEPLTAAAIYPNNAGNWRRLGRGSARCRLPRPRLSRSALSSTPPRPDCQAPDCISECRGDRLRRHWALSRASRRHDRPLSALCTV